MNAIIALPPAGASVQGRRAGGPASRTNVHAPAASSVRHDQACPSEACPSEVCNVSDMRDLRQAAVNRHEREPLPPADQALVEAEHPENPRGGQRHGQASQRLHVLHTRGHGDQAAPPGSGRGASSALVAAGPAEGLAAAAGPAEGLAAVATVPAEGLAVAATGCGEGLAAAATTMIVV